MEGVDIYPHYATFADPHTVRVGDELIEGETIVINAGGRPREIALPGIEVVNWLNNVRILELEELPPHLIIVGGSYISLEFGQAFRRLGSEVTILEAGPQLIFREDADIAEKVQEILEDEGVTVHLGAHVKRLAQEGDEKIAVFFEQDGQPRQVRGTHLLLAVGRRPNSDRLNLEAAGVEVDEQGYIAVNDIMQTNVPHIFAVGDINGEGAFTHTAVNDGEIFWDTYSGEDDRRLGDRIVTYALFTDPPLGRVGMSAKEALASGRNVLMGTMPMRAIARAREKGETAGMVKILVDGDTEEFLGVAILGIGGDEIVNMFTPFMYTGKSYKLFRKAVLTHPTVAELMPWVLYRLRPLEE
ncbi:MAG: FAD-dependent oxidoreductase, partial [Candidatus Promineifilaceae bacterium]|nr:FAD-dependent oxidoreductase [Candidatus Promineifilaceae bacterium]